jgi:sugar diacid utilization regulator/putative methionine-R-sulfoxide reductase with GAF domain
MNTTDVGGNSAESAAAQGSGSMRTRLDEAEARLSALESLGQAMSSRTLADFISLVMQTLTRHIPAERGTLLLLDDSGSYLQERGSFTADGSVQAPYSLPVARTAGGAGIGVSVHVFLTGEPYFWQESRSDPIFIPEHAGRYNAHNTLTVPLKCNDQVIGVFHLINSARGAFTENDAHFLVGISAQLAALSNECRMREALDRKNQELEKSMAIHEDFTSAALEGDDVKGIAVLLSTVLGMGVVVQDRALNLVAAVSRDGRVDVACGEDVCEKYRRLGRDRVDALMREGARRKTLVRALGAALTDEGATLFLMPIVAGKEHLGSLTVSADRDLSELDTVAIKQAAAVLALRITLEQREFEMLERLRGGLLTGIMNSDFASDSIAYERAALLGYQLSPPFRAVVIETEWPRGGARLGGQAPDDAVCQRFAQTWPGLIAARRGRTIVVLASGEMARDSSQMVAGIVDEVSQSYGGARVWCGTGGACDSLRDARVSYQQAKKAASVGRELGGDRQVFDYDDLGVYRLLMAVGGRGDLEEFVQRRLGPLMAYDEEKGSNLVGTLKAFLKDKGSNKRVATLLNVHLNTLKYRLKRIEELCGVSLDDQEAVFELHLALKAMPVLNTEVVAETPPTRR